MTTQRNVSWLELFYDLIFVAAAHQLATMLAHSTTLLEAATPLLLFIPILWCWMTHTLFTTQFADRSWFYHVMTFGQIIGTVILVILLPTALKEHAVYFSYALAGVKMLLAIQYGFWSVMEIHRFLHMLPVTICNACAAVLWFVSSLSPNPIWWWVLALAVDMLTPALTKTKDLAANMNPHHLPERLGLLTVVVLGEMIISLVISSYDKPLTRELLYVLVSGLAITFLIFWTYFRFVDSAILGNQKSTSRIYFYSHVPLVIGLICIAGGLKGVMADLPADFLLATGIIFFTLSMRLQRFCQDQRWLKRQIALIFLLLPVLVWYCYYASTALINVAVLTGSFAVYIIVADFFMGWNTQSVKNAPMEGRVQWDK